MSVYGDKQREVVAIVELFEMGLRGMPRNAILIGSAGRWRERNDEMAKGGGMKSSKENVSLTSDQIGKANAIAKSFGADFAEFDGIVGTDAIGADKALKLVSALSAVGLKAVTARSPLALSLYVHLVAP